MAGRILAAAVAALALVLLVPARLGGEPTGGAPTTTTPDIFGALGLPEPAAPHPLRLYPRRPGAKYEDVEARAGHAVDVGFTSLLLLAWSVEPHDALRVGATPAVLDRYRALGLADGYTPTASSTGGDVLRIVVRVKAFLSSEDVACVATAASDGTMLLPYDRRPDPTTSTTPPRTPRAGNVELFLPIGARRGRFYVTCRSSQFDALFADSRRAVWAIDV